MEKVRVTSPKGDPPDYSKTPLSLPKASTIFVTGSDVKICDNEARGFKECKIPFGEFLVRMPSLSIQVESVCIWFGNDSTEVQFKEVCKILRTMPSLHRLKLSLSSSLKELSKLLLDMRMLHTFELAKSEMNESDAKLLVDTLLQIQGLSICELHIGQFGSYTGEQDSVAMKHLCRYLKAPTCVLTRLDFIGLVSDKALSLLASVLGENKSLEYLRIRLDRSFNLFHQPSGMDSIGDALQSNTTLKTLEVRANKFGALEMKKLVAALIPDSSGSQPNSTLINLALSVCKVEGGNGVEHLCTLIKCNTSLLKLDVKDWEELKQGSNYPVLENVEKLLTSLQSNRALKHLNLYGNTGIGGKKVLGMIMDMLLHNHTILHISLFETRLEQEGDAEIVYAELRKRQKHGYELWQSVADMPPVLPNSARIFFCGNEEAGKTTICQKWDQDVQPQERRKKWHIITNLFWKTSQQE